RRNGENSFLASCVRKVAFCYNRRNLSENQNPKKAFDFRLQPDALAHQIDSYCRGQPHPETKSHSDEDNFVLLWLRRSKRIIRSVNNLKLRPFLPAFETLGQFGL